MTVDEEVNAFLEHFGAKGMKWGVRKSKAERDSTPKKKKPPLTKQQRIKRNQFRKQVAVSGALVGFYLSMEIVSRKLMEGPSIPSGFKLGGDSGSTSGHRGSKSAKDLINDRRDVKINSVKKTLAEGFIDKEQAANFISKLNRKYDLKVSQTT